MSQEQQVPDSGVVELLGLLSYATLVAFDSLARDARYAPDLQRRVRLSEMAAQEFANHQRLAHRLIERGHEPAALMRSYVKPLDDFHNSTRPQGWLQTLIKAYVGDGIADDFYREVAAMLPSPDWELVLEVLHDDGRTDYLVGEVKAAIAADPHLADTLALWARRLVGEAISQAQHVAAENDPLTELVVAGTGDLAGIGSLITRLTTAHTQRLATLGLNS